MTSFRIACELLDDVRIARGHLHAAPLLDAVRDVEDVRHEHRVEGGDRASGLGHERRRRDLLLVADRLDRVDDVVRVLLDRVVHGGVEGRLRAVVVDAEAAAEVQVLDRHAERAELGVDAPGLADRVLDLPDVGDLRADVEVEHHHRVEHPAALQDLDGLEDLGRRQPELRGLAARLRPLARPARVELDPHAEEGLHARAAGATREDPVELGDLLEDEDDLLAAAGSPFRAMRDAGVVLVAVADDQRLGREVRSRPPRAAPASSRPRGRSRRGVRPR